MIMKLCLRCESPIINRRKDAKYCSNQCSKRYLKSEYKKRNREKQNAYTRKYRKARNGGNAPQSRPWNYREDQCLACGSTEDLQLAHIKPLWAGGTHKYVITLCRTHHHQFDKLLRDFWKDAIIKL